MKYFKDGSHIECSEQKYNDDYKRFGYVLEDAGPLVDLPAGDLVFNQESGREFIVDPVFADTEEPKQPEASASEPVDPKPKRQVKK